MEKIQCYNCGNYFDRKAITREHVPAQNMFNGYSEEYKKDRITVPGCSDCNGQYSKIDQELRDAIGILNDKDPKQAEVTRQAVKSILRRKDHIERIEFLPSGLFNVKFKYSDFVELNKKNFRALFYKKYGYTIDENEYGIQVICEGDEYNESAMRIFSMMYDYLMDGGDWLISGHEDIFQYRIKSFKVISSTQIVDTPNLNDTVGLTAIMVYHKTLCAVVTAMKRDFMQKMAEARNKK